MSEISTPEIAFQPIDYFLGTFLSQLSGLTAADKKLFNETVIALSQALNTGHTYLDLSAQALSLFTSHELVSHNGSTPLVLMDKRLYFQRYWQYEQQLAQKISKNKPFTLDQALLEQQINLHFDLDDAAQNDQRQAVKKALQQQFAIISGGPGTGKTTTVIRLLAILQHFYHGKLKIALAAPTGKAAMRLSEAMNGGKINLILEEGIGRSIPEEVSTIHRLLGAKYFSPSFRHHQQNPLTADVVVIDEASMVDLALMSKLVAAIRDDARLILLGDKNQLASVESGVVLADLCQALPENTAILQHTWRFNAQIKALAEAINKQQSEQAWQLLNDPQMDKIRLFDAHLLSYVSKKYQDYARQLKQNTDLKKLFERFNKFQILCSNRSGKQGVTHLNQQIERQLIKDYDLKIDAVWYHGRPIIIRQNDPITGLYNGDVGLCLKEPDGYHLWVYFIQPNGEYRALSPARLPRCRTFYAMTIHQSQGSEFEQVMVVLAETMNPVLTKELIYTAVTRAKNKVLMVADEGVFKQSIAEKIVRRSGLVEEIKKRQ